MAAFLFFGMQSLADVARREAERRLLLEQQGVEAKVIERDSGQRVTDEMIKHEKAPSSASARASVLLKTNKNGGSTRNYRSVVQRLDKAILKEERRLEVKRERLQSARSAPPRISGRAAGNQTSNSLARIQSEIEDIEDKLKQLRQERRDEYEEGLKAGFLPGELDGKGIIP
jgi:hypothetical protein